MTGQNRRPIAVPDAGLYRCLDARRRVGLADPKWSLTDAERDSAEEFLTAIGHAVDNANLGTTHGGVPPTREARREVELLAANGLKPGERDALRRRQREVIQDLIGDSPPAKWAGLLSGTDPATGLESEDRRKTGWLFAAVAAIVGGVIANRLGAGFWNSLFTVAIVGCCALVMIGVSSYKVRNNDLRLSRHHLDHRNQTSRVRVITPAASSYATAYRLSSAAQAMLGSSSWRSVHDNNDIADLLAERDRILDELIELDAREERLRAIADDIDHANVGDHAALVEEVTRRRDSLDRSVLRVVELSHKAVEQDDQTEAGKRSQRARRELDGLAAPHPRAITQKYDEADEDDQDYWRTMQ